MCELAAAAAAVASSGGGKKNLVQGGKKGVNKIKRKGINRCIPCRQIDTWKQRSEDNLVHLEEIAFASPSQNQSEPLSVEGRVVDRADKPGKVDRGGKGERTAKTRH